MNDQNKRIEARNGFLAACSLAGASTTAYRSSKGDAESTVYWLDIARLGAPDANAVLILCCGLHGEEGYCGSRFLTHWLQQGSYKSVSRDIGLVFIHTVLPTGLSLGGVAAPVDVGDRNWSDNVLGAAANRFARYARSKGLAADEQTMDSVSPNSGEAWLVDAFKAIAAEVNEHARNVILIEFHTSLRPLGEVTVSSPHAAGGAADRRAVSWFGEAAGARNGGPAALDSFALGFGDYLRELTLTAIHADFGVYTTKSILQLDARKTPMERRADIGGLFSPDTQTWQQTVQDQGTRIVEQALRGLSAS